MDINEWLKNFRDRWINHDIGGVLRLFDKNVIYYETPQRKLNNIEEISKEWESVKGQKNISLRFEVFSSTANKHSIIWTLEYTNKENQKRKASGTYLIKLNLDGLCTYFLQSC